MKSMMRLISFIFTPYFVGLLLICGLILSYVYPKLIAQSKYPVEYRIGKWVGYIFILGGISFFIIAELFG
ncbi:MAG TPA: hypothetical protein PK830_10140 [Candidatus Atribacteria bacterium]|nr:hypothetical protein [Candidatus Atribacteria bacterium]HPT79440.1 hypothetical protein [Candidatus Atribacteria bacterium]